ncbi:MAG: alkane 1-monooxygenase [Myxococcota bacterium]
MEVVKYAVIYLIVALYAVTVAWGGWAPLWVPIWVFGLIPALDLWIGRDDRPPGPQHWLHDLALRLWVPVQSVAIAATVALAPHRAGWENVLNAVILGIVTGAGGITIAHELIHRTSKVDRALGEVLMASVSYTWFCVEHVLGHHRWVATARDPATSRLGESVYRFVPRSVVGGLVSFWRLERDYAGRRGIPWWSLRDRRTRYAAGLAALWTAVGAVAGPVGLGLFALQGAVAVGLLEVINYVEHYGLLRVEVRPGEFERVKPKHSWNSTHWLTSAFLFNLPRHADHHAYASRPYWDLRPWPDAPELPLGYASMVVVALVPPVWFRTMNPRVEAVRAGDAILRP